MSTVSEPSVIVAASDVAPLDLDLLTFRQRAVLASFLRFYREWGVPPTTREMMILQGFKSPNGVICHFKFMIRKGIMRKLAMPGADGAASSRAFRPRVPPDHCFCCRR